jgi:hypothetical protein
MTWSKNYIQFLIFWRWTDFEIVNILHNSPSIPWLKFTDPAVDRLGGLILDALLKLYNF